MPKPSLVVPFADLDSDDLSRVGGKNASLGEMIAALDAKGVRVPGGFATTADAYRQFIAESSLEDPIRARIDAHREDHGFDQLKVALSVGVQTMVRSDTGAAGVMFSLDTDTGFPRTVLINGAWGLGETVVQGSVDPDELLVFKPLLDNDRLTPIIARTSLPSSYAPASIPSRSTRTASWP